MSKLLQLRSIPLLYPSALPDTLPEPKSPLCLLRSGPHYAGPADTSPPHAPCQALSSMPLAVSPQEGVALEAAEFTLPKKLSSSFIALQAVALSSSSAAQACQEEPVPSVNWNAACVLDVEHGGEHWCSCSCLLCLHHSLE